MIINKAITFELNAADHDPRTISEQIQEGYAYADAKITSKSKRDWGDNAYGISVEFVGADGLHGGFGFSSKEIYDKLRVGQIIQAITDNPMPTIGGRSNGFVVDGEIVGFKTPLQLLAEDLTNIAEQDRKERDEWEQKGHEIERQIDALPKKLRALVHGWLETSPKFKFKLDYELGWMQLAVKIIDYVNERQWTEEQFLAWVKGEGEQEHDYDKWVDDNDATGGFSGHQVGYAGRVAMTILYAPEQAVPFKEGVGGIPPAISAILGWPIEEKYTDA